MTTASLQPPAHSEAKHYCNVAAQALGIDPAGHARAFDDAILIETALPWRGEIYQKAGALPQQVIDLLALWLERYRQGTPYTHCPLLLAPDPAHAQPGMRRVIHFTRPAGAFARYARAEYLAPDALVGPLVWALYEAPEQLPAFAPYRVAEPDGVAEPGSVPVRDLLVCTHGSVDVACARFGVPLFRTLRDAESGAALRIWRVSHFGGHIFAPTLLEMPHGLYWAFVGEAQGRQIARRSGDVAQLRRHYRGWAGAADGFAQAAECEGWQRHGWAWFELPRATVQLAGGGGEGEPEPEADPQWSEVRLDVAGPDGVRPACQVRVESGAPLLARPHSADATPWPHAQYVITRYQTCM